MTYSLRRPIYGIEDGQKVRGSVSLPTRLLLWYCNPWCAKYLFSDILVKVDGRFKNKDIGEYGSPIFSKANLAQGLKK
jgi:hypothetical protein